MVITSKQQPAAVGGGSRCQSPVVSSSTPPRPPPTPAPTPQRHRVWKSVVGALLEAQKSNPSIPQNQQQQYEFPSTSRDLATVSGIPAPVDVITSVDEASVSSSSLPHMADKSSVGAGASFPVPSARKIRPLTGDQNHVAAGFPGIQPVVEGVDSAVPAAPGASSERQKQTKDLPPVSEVNEVSLKPPAESEMSSQVTCQATKSVVNMTPSGKPNQGVMTPARKPGLVSMTPRSMTLTPMAMSMTPSGKPTFASSPMPPRTPRGSQVRFSTVLRIRIRDPVPF